MPSLGTPRNLKNYLKLVGAFREGMNSADCPHKLSDNNKSYLSSREPLRAVGVIVADCPHNIKTKKAKL